MARRRKMDPERKAFINSLLEHYQPKDAQDIQDMLKDLLGETLQGMLEAEMDDHLGYSKYDYKNKETDDSRNGYSPKTVTSSMGTIDLDIPRDRKGEIFEPQIVKKESDRYLKTLKIRYFSMYAKRNDDKRYLRSSQRCLRCGCIRRNDITYDRSNPSYRKRMAKPAAGKKICHCFYGCGTFPCSGGQSNGKKGSLRCYRC